MVSFSSATSSCKRWECPGAPYETCIVNDMDHCWYGGRSGGFHTCVPEEGNVDMTAHMFEFWEELAAKKAKEGQDTETAPATHEDRYGLDQLAGG